MAVWCQDVWVANENRQALSTTCGDVHAIAAVEKADSARGFLRRGTGHRVDYDGCFLALKLVDGSDTRSYRESFTERTDLGIEWGDDKNVVD